MHSCCSVLEFDAQPIGSSYDASIQKFGVHRLETNGGRLRSAQFQVKSTTESGDCALPRIVGRKDVLNAKADRFGEEIESGGQYCHGHYDSGTGSIACIGHGVRIIEFSATFGVRGEQMTKTRVRRSWRVDDGGP